MRGGVEGVGWGAEGWWVVGWCWVDERWVGWEGGNGSGGSKLWLGGVLGWGRSRVVAEGRCVGERDSNGWAG